MIKRLALPSDPVDDLTPEVGGRAVKLNGVFKAGHDWLKGLKVKAKNRSGKTILFAEALLIVPKSGTMVEPLGIPVRYGELPAADSTNPSASKPVPHGAVFRLSVSDDTFDTVMTFLTDHQVTNVVGVELAHLMVVFDDDTAWNDGTLLRRDRTRPYSWKSAGPSKPIVESKPSGAVFQNISFTGPAKYYSPRLVEEAELYSCASFFKYDYLLCDEVMGNWACTAEDDSARDKDLDETQFDADRKALVSTTVLCKGLACNGKTKSVHIAQYDYRCGYSGGNEWQ
jgi:hypothetical protein